MADQKPRIAVCKSCGAAVYWTITANGKFMPVNATPDPNGGFVLTLKASDGELYAEALLPHHGDARRRFTSHFATCKFAAEHRR